MKEIFETLRKINVNDHTEKVRQNNIELTYLSWPCAVDEISKRYDFEYRILWFDGKPWLYDENLGYMVFTSVTIDKITKEMWLPVMDSHNRAMKDRAYTVKTKYKEITVEPATMFDINKAIMRCLTKNLAMFGLGLYIYAGEDLPESESQDAKKDLAKEIYEIYKENKNSSTLLMFINSALNGKKLSELPDKELRNLKTVIDGSINKIKQEQEEFENESIESGRSAN